MIIVWLTRKENNYLTMYIIKWLHAAYLDG